MSATMVEVGKLYTVDFPINDDEIQSHEHPIAMLITFDSVESLHEAIESREINFSAWGDEKALEVE